MKKDLFLCSNCGTLLNENGFDIIYNEILCSCGKRITMEDSYPNLQSIDLIVSSELLYKNCVKKDNDNKKKVQMLLTKTKIDLEDRILDSIINLYEKGKNKFLDNDRDIFINFIDDFDFLLSNKGFNDEERDTITSFLDVYMKNKIRKPFIVMCAASIEMLFNDFFNDVIVKKFSSEASVIIKKQYSKENINKRIILANAFLDNRFFKESNNISDNFMDNWQELRTIRNKILHNNDLYITRNIINQNFKLLQESMLVFSNLKSKLLFNNY